jgi:putative acetyltransferase
MGEPVIAQADPREHDIVALLETHLEFSNEHSPPEHVHALDLAGLIDPLVSFFSMRDNGTLLAVGALRELDATHGEIKSMHTVGSIRRRGAGRTMLEYILETARSRGYTRVSLETGTMEAYAPARALYASVGFQECPPFGDYWENEYSMCMTLELDGSS